ncbi:MAG: hypothetical protein ACE5J4_00055 [Candidatus Aenigmatarchaeota archaeon]
MMLLFITLILIATISISIYSFFYDKKNLILLALLVLFSILTIFYWYIAILILFFLFFYKKISFGKFISFNIFTTILLSWFFFNLFLFELNFYFFITLVSLVFVSVLAIFAIFQSKLKEFLLLSTVIQILFIIADLSLAKLFGELQILGTIQIFNYIFPGLVLFLAIGIFARNKTYIYQLKGSYFTNKWNDIFVTIACLSLAGLPVFNMFVPKWIFLTTSFFLAPAIAIFGIFATLILFVMYYKIVYVLLVGEGKEKFIPRPVTLINGILAFFCLILGIFPQIQWFILFNVI